MAALAAIGHLVSARSAGTLTLEMSPLTIFGLFAVTAMLVCYALEDRHRLFVLGFAVACALGSIYGFLQGAWPFGIVEAIWAGVAVRRWQLRGGSPPAPSRGQSRPGG